MTVRVGEQIFRLQGRYSRAANRTLDSFFKDLNKEMVIIGREIADFYSDLLLGFALDPVSGVIKPTLYNSGRISASKNRAERMAKQFVTRIHKKLKTGRRSFLDESKERDKELGRLLKKIGEQQERGKKSDRTKQLLQQLSEDSNDAITAFFQKWIGYYPSILTRGLTSGQRPQQIKELLLLPNGHIRIGSSLEESVAREAAMDLLEQRTAATLAEARELKLDSCWNANPMDNLTKPVCAQASTAGVIPIGDMEGNYGMPPRYICRCDLMIVSSEWKDLNKGINQSIEKRRQEVVEELRGAEAKKASWDVAGYTRADGTVVKGYTAHVDPNKYPLRAEGLEHYALTGEKLKAWDVPVPEYI